MSKEQSIEFRQDVTQVVRNREPGLDLKRICADFGIHAITLSRRLKKPTTRTVSAVVSREQSQMN